MNTVKTVTKVCEMCGQTFEAKSRLKRFCDRDHYATCCICGKQFLIPKNNVGYYFDRLDHVTCSPECKAKLSISQHTSEERAAAIRNGMIKKYGVVNAGQLKSAIEKREQTNIERYGNKAPTATAEVQAKTRKTNLERYGTEYVTRTESFKQKAKESNLAKYGVESYAQTAEFQQKSAQTMKERYGVEHALQSPEIVAQMKARNLEKYGVDHPMKLPEVQAKNRAAKLEHCGDANYQNEPKKIQTNLERYGKEYYTQTAEYRQRVENTDLQKYGVRHHLQSPEVIAKRKQTCIEKYGSDNIFSSEYGMAKVRQTMLAKYGVTNPSQNPDMKAKATKAARNSSLELRILDLFANYNIDVMHHYFLSNSELGISHEFDFYLPKYKLLIDADGLYFHSYLDDPDGKHVLDYYDDIRLKLVPSDHMFYLIVEGDEVSQVKQLITILEHVDNGLFNYDSYLFDWCRSIDFPYSSYPSDRLQSDWKHLQNYDNANYVPQARIGESIIKQYHRSLYDCHKDGCLSPIAGWYNDDIIKAVIKNRLIYVNNVDPSKILRGFSVSKLCPVVSIFNPILAKYLVQKYLNEFDLVFDPFSGFSGRMLGVASLNKLYIGQDLNTCAVQESNQIIDFLGLDSQCSVSEHDILSSSGDYDCLFTCPPYGKKEVYANETVFKSCDGWILECLVRFECKRYVFVVDKTDRYSKYVVEILKSTSHFATSQEQVVVIDRCDRDLFVLSNYLGTESLAYNNN